MLTDLIGRTVLALEAWHRRRAIRWARVMEAEEQAGAIYRVGRDET